MTRSGWMVWVVLAGCVADPEAGSDTGLDEGSLDGDVAEAGRIFPGACSEPPAAMTCGELNPEPVPVPEDCVEDLVVEAVFGLDTLAGPFEGPRPVSAWFVADEVGHGEPRWSLTGDVPPGVWIDACSGELQGTLDWPAGGDVFAMAVVEGPDGCRMGRIALETALVTCAILPPEPQTYRLNPAVLGSPYADELLIWNPEGGTGRGRVRLAAGELPAGLTLDCDGARLVGTPEVAGEFSFQIEWIEYACGGISAVDEVQLTVFEAPCGGCAAGEICVQSFDGTCTGPWFQCVANPLGCTPGTCTAECSRSLCPQEPPHSCNVDACGGEIPGAFRCYGP